jgi:hypothetical protein
MGDWTRKREREEMLAATPLLYMWSQCRMWQLAMEQHAAVQERELLLLLASARQTRFGRDHDFSRISNVAEFQERVPLRRYDDFWRDYWKDEFPVLENCSWPGKIPYFALTSGTTTGVTKYIPCSQQMLAANYRGAQDLLFHHLHNRPTSGILGGKSLVLGGSTDLRELAPGVHCGDMSGIEASEMPWWLESHVFPPRELALIADWEEKIDLLARRALEEDIRAITAMPSWLLLFFDKLAELVPDREQKICSYFPKLELLTHGGVDFRPYASRFSELLEGSRAELREVYPASEAFIAVADRGQGEGLRPVFDNGVFFEFVPLDEIGSTNPTRHWIADVEPGMDYAVVVSTCAGLWAYMLGDTVRFTDLDPPRLLVTGRSSFILSAFGEHLINAEIEDAVASASAGVACDIRDYCVAPLFPEREGQKPAHRFVVEFAGEAPPDRSLDGFAKALDARLQSLNADYRTHRAGDYALGAPVVEAVAPGSFAAWMKSRGQLGGQHKVPRIILDKALIANLDAFLCEKGMGKNG